MQTIQCPKCGEVFSVDESGYAAIVKQVRDREFSAEIAQREQHNRKLYKTQDKTEILSVLVSKIGTLYRIY